MVCRNTPEILQMNPPKVLIVDDDDIQRTILRHTLGGEACLLLEAGDGQQALEIVDREMPDLILLDVMMPVMDGIETLRRLKADNRTSQIPVIIITALTAESDVAASLEEGAIDHICKPFSELIVRTRVRAALRNRAAAVASAAGATPLAKRGRLIGFLGAKGGVGVTTAAVNTALAMAAPQRSVVLLELHASPGTVARQLDVLTDRNLGVLFAQAADGNLNSVTVSKYLTNHRSGVQVLLAPPTIDHRREVRAQQAENLLYTLGGMFDFVIVDLPELASPATRAALLVCDFIVLTLELEATCLGLSQEVFASIVSGQIASGRVGALLILHQSSAGTLITVGYARSQLTCPMIGVIPPCGDQNLQALKIGVPVVHSAPSCAAAIAYNELGARLMADRIQALTF